MSPNPSLERDLHRHGTWPARRSGLSSASRAKRHPGVGPSAQTLGSRLQRLGARQRSLRRQSPPNTKCPPCSVPWRSSSTVAPIPSGLAALPLAVQSPGASRASPVQARSPVALGCSACTSCCALKWSSLALPLAASSSRASVARRAGASAGGGERGALGRSAVASKLQPSLLKSSLAKRRLGLAPSTAA